MNNVQVTLTICAGFDGGIIVYESTDSESRLVFGGDHEAATKYLAGRMARLIDENDAPVGENIYSAPPVVAKLPTRTVAATKLADRLQRIDEVTDH